VERKNRISIGGLRKADPTHLAILLQDVLRRPVTQIEPGTLADLLALSEIPEQLPTAMAKDLGRFHDQMMRELGDLPAGTSLADLLSEFAALDASRIPSCLRTGLREACGESKHEEVAPAFEKLVAHWESGQPSDLVLPRAAAPAPAATKSSAARPSPSSPPKTVVPTKRPTRRPSRQVDTRREDWVREDVMSRLVNYPGRGLKEPILVAGSLHRSPFDDLTSPEVLAVLRKLKREGRVRFSAGRWIMAGT
jgi:hypothetical protein